MWGRKHSQADCELHDIQGVWTLQWGSTNKNAVSQKNVQNKKKRLGTQHLI